MKRNEDVIEMDRSIIGIAIVEVLVAVLGVGALAYNGNFGSSGAEEAYSNDYRHGDGMWGMMNSGDDGSQNWGDGRNDDTSSVMCGDHAEEYDYDND